MAWTKRFHFITFYGPHTSLVSIHTEITMDNGAKLKFGRNFEMRDGAKIRVYKDGKCVIGDNSAVNSNNIIVCYERIEIDDDLQLSPNV